MKTYRLIRLADGPDGTLGVLESDGGQTFYVLEEEAQGNRPKVSRIPADTYTCKRSHFHGGGYECFEVVGVKDRSRILIHKGNTEEDTEGCILVGHSVRALRVQDEDGKGWRRKLALGHSRHAFERFMGELRDVDSFQLRIFDPGEAT